MQNKLKKIHDKVRQLGISPGCWIAGAVPRSSTEIIDKLEDLLTLIDPEHDSSESRNCYPNEAFDEWCDEVIDELSHRINFCLAIGGFYASWEAGDFIIRELGQDEKQ